MSFLKNKNSILLLNNNSKQDKTINHLTEHKHYFHHKTVQGSNPTITEKIHIDFERIHDFSKLQKQKNYTVFYGKHSFVQSTFIILYVQYNYNQRRNLATSECWIHPKKLNILFSTNGLRKTVNSFA